jgi:peptidoglycan/xylan/chitin deacetylase (PgdA/CDA1 family)
MRKSTQLVFLTFLLFSGCSEKENDTPETQNGSIVILMYHKIVQGEAKTIYERSSADFERDLEYLSSNNIEVIDFEDLMTHISSGSVPHGRHALLTFDDGDESWYDIVLPALVRHGFKATFFLWVSQIGNPSFITWDKVRLMSMYRHPDGTNPFIFGSHTFTHQYLEQRKTGFSTEASYQSFLDYEMGESKRKIEAETGLPVKLLALPFGDGAGDEQIITAAIRNGYKLIRTSIISAVDISDFNFYKLPGIAILNTTSREDLENYFLTK